MNPDQQISSIFKKIENKLKEEKKEAQRAIELEKFKKRQEEEERRRKKQERIVYFCIFLFLCFMTSLVHYAHKQGMIKQFATFVVNAMNGARKVNCEDPANWSLSLCVQQKQDQVDAKWANMFLNRKGKEKPFAIHKENRTEENNPSKPK